MRRDKMVMEGKRDWSGLIMIHREIPELLPSLRCRQPRTKISYYAAILRQRALKIPATPSNYVHSFGTNNTSHSSGTQLQTDRGSDAPLSGGTGSPSDPPVKQGELLRLSQCGSVLFTRSRCVSEERPQRPVLQPKRSGSRLDEAGPLYQSRVGLASSLSTHPSTGENEAQS